MPLRELREKRKLRSLFRVESAFVEGRFTIRRFDSRFYWTAYMQHTYISDDDDDDDQHI